MPSELIIGLLVGVALVVGTGVVFAKGQRLGAPIRILAMVVFLVAAFFSVFGFAGSFEPGDFHVVWRVLFAVIFISSAVGAGRILLTKK